MNCTSPKRPRRSRRQQRVLRLLRRSLRSHLPRRRVRPWPPARDPRRGIRVDAGQLDDLVGLAGESLSSRIIFKVSERSPAHQGWVHTLEALERVSRQIRDTSLDLRMVPVDELFSPVPAQSSATSPIASGKEIELKIVGQETRLDRTIVERLREPMIHLIRNAVDHALESPQERVARGKSPHGRITLLAGPRPPGG